MKKVLFLFIGALATIFLGSCNCQEESEDQVYLFSYFTGRGEDGLFFAYSEDGRNWQAMNDRQPLIAPEVGKDSLMRDPFVLEGQDGKFHMIWTTGWHDRHIGYASSDDLINWSEQKTIPVMEHEPEARNCWAPEMIYDDENEEYLIFWATTIPGRHSDIGHEGEEAGLNHRMYSTTTKDFETFSETEMFYNPDFSVIDCNIIERDNKYYMFLKNENPNPPEKNIRIAVSDSPSGPYPTEVSEPITGDYWAEGPTALEVGDSVYVYFDKYREHVYGAVRSKDMKNWDDVSDQVSFPGGTRHGHAFKVDRSVFENMQKAFKE